MIRESGDQANRNFGPLGTAAVGPYVCQFGSGKAKKNHDCKILIILNPSPQNRSAFMSFPTRTPLMLGLMTKDANVDIIFYTFSVVFKSLNKLPNYQFLPWKNSQLVARKLKKNSSLAGVFNCRPDKGFEMAIRRYKAIFFTQCIGIH